MTCWLHNRAPTLAISPTPSSSPFQYGSGTAPPTHPLTSLEFFPQLTYFLGTGTQPTEPPSHRKGSDQTNGPRTYVPKEFLSPGKRHMEVSERAITLNFFRPSRHVDGMVPTGCTIYCTVLYCARTKTWNKSMHRQNIRWQVGWSRWVGC